MTRHQRLWVVVADGEHARILVPGEVADSYTTLQSVDSIAAHHRASDMGTDAPGRTFESANVTRHAIAPRSDPHRKAKHDFVAWLAGWVGEAAARDEFDRLVLVAPAHALATLRSGLNAAAAERLAGVLQRDLVKTADHEIVRHLTWDVLHGGTLTH